MLRELKDRPFIVTNKTDGQQYPVTTSSKAYALVLVTKQLGMGVYEACCLRVVDAPKAPRSKKGN